MAYTAPDLIPSYLRGTALGAWLLQQLRAIAYGGPGDVRAQGVVGDGQTDDTAAVQAAMVANAGGVIDFGNLTVKLTAPLVHTLAMGSMQWRGTGATLRKYHTGDLLRIEAPFVEVHDLAFDAAVAVNPAFGTSGRGIVLRDFDAAIAGSTTPRFRACNLTITNIDSGGLVFGDEAGSGSHISNYFYTPYTSDYGNEGIGIQLGADKGNARPRQFTNINTGTGIIRMGGNADQSFVNVFCRRIEHHALDSLCGFNNVRYGNLGNPISLNGQGCFWIGFTSSGQVVLAPELINSIIIGYETHGGGWSDLSNLSNMLLALGSPPYFP